MPEMYTQVLCSLAGHYRRFIKGFANIAHPLYDMLGKEVKMGPVDLPPEAQAQAFKEEVPKAPLCPIRVYAPLELVHLDYTSIEFLMELNKPPMVKNILVMTDHFTRYALAVVMKDQTAKTVMKVFYEHFIAVFGVPAKLLSDRGTNFTSALVEELCAAFSIQKCWTTAYHAQ